MQMNRNNLFLTIIFFLLTIVSTASANEADKRYTKTILQLQEGYKGIDNAIADFNDIVAVYPNYWKAHLGSANGYLIKYDFSDHKENEWLEQSLVHLNVLIDNGQHLSEAHFRRALVQLNLNKISEAKTDLGQALEVNPAYLEAHLIYLHVLLSNNEHTAANEKGALWISHYSAGSPAAHKFGDLFFAAKDYENARHYYEKSLKHNPDDSSALMSLGKCYQNFGKDEKASKLFKQVLLLTPDNYEARFLNGVSLSNMERLETAIEEFEIYRKSFPKEISALNNLAVLYEKSGNLLKAKLMWLKVKELSSGPEHKKRAESNLLRLLQASGTKDKKVETDDNITALMRAERETQSAQPGSPNNNFTATGRFDVYNNYSMSHATKLQQADQMAELDMQNINVERQAAEAERLQKMQRDQELQGQAMEWQAALDKQASDSARKTAEWEATHSFGAYATAFLGTVLQTTIGSFTSGLITPVATTLANKAVVSLFDIDPADIDSYNDQYNSE